MTAANHDVVVVGAGPAGTAAAIDLRLAGASVLLLDRHRGRGGKPCAGALTAKAVRRLRFDLGPVARKAEKAAEFRLRGRFVGRAEASEAIAVTTVRAEFDMLCLGHAIERGVEFRATAVAQIEERERTVAVRTTDGRECVARFVVGADGAASRTRRLIEGPPQRTALAVEGLASSMRTSRTDGLVFDVGAIPGGYGWAFGKGDHVNVGLYVADGRGGLSKGALENYAERVLGVHELENVVGHALGTGGGRPWLGTRRVLLAGDAAGTAERLLGEGIHNALASGQTAAAAIVEALATGRDARRRYAEALVPVVEDLLLCERLSRLLYGWPAAGVAALSLPRVGNGLAAGFARGLTLREILDERASRTTLGRFAAALLGHGRRRP